MAGEHLDCREEIAMDRRKFLWGLPAAALGGVLGGVIAAPAASRPVLTINPGSNYRRLGARSVNAWKVKRAVRESVMILRRDDPQSWHRLKRA